MNYLVIHNHPHGLVLSQKQRDGLFSTGKLLGIVESDLYSLQAEMFERYRRRPLGLILWGVADRYGVAREADIELLEANSWSDCRAYCDGSRPHECALTTDDGNHSTMTHWCPPGSCDGKGLKS